jgi:hypothetical protein
LLKKLMGSGPFWSSGLGKLWDGIGFWQGITIFRRDHFFFAMALASFVSGLAARSFFPAHLRRS